jgi:hypothetical protein
MIFDKLKFDDDTKLINPLPASSFFIVLQTA